MLLRLLQLRAFRLSKTLGHILTCNWSWGATLLPIFLVRRSYVARIGCSNRVSTDWVSLNDSTMTFILDFGSLVTYQYMSTIGDVELQMSLAGHFLIREMVHLCVLSKRLVFVKSIWISRLHLPLRRNFPIQRLNRIVVLICDIHFAHCVGVFNWSERNSCWLDMLISTTSMVY